MLLTQTDKLYISSTSLSLLVIEPTGFCNAKCPHCPRYTDDGFLHDYIPEKHLTVEALKNGLDPLKLQSLNKVEFAGATGDPAMSPHIEDLISFFDFVPIVTIDTNGSIRNKDWWRDLARFSNLQVVWSIDGLRDTNHFYRIGVDYKKIMENSAAFISAGGNAVWKCIIFKHNEHQVDEIIQQAKSLGFSKVIFHRAYDYRFQNQLSWPVLVEGKFMHNIEPSTLSQEIIESKAVNFVQSKVVFKSKKSSTDILCPWARDRMAYINVLGQLMPCCMMTHETTNDYIGKTIFQEIVGGDFNNISLYHHDMDYIFENYFGEEFNKKLKNEDTMHPVCAKTCSGIIKGISTKVTGYRESMIKIDKNKNDSE